MKCPFCFSKTSVKKTEYKDDLTKRRLRYCTECSFRGSYIEQLDKVIVTGDVLKRPEKAV